MIPAGDAQPGCRPAGRVPACIQLCPGLFVEILCALNKESRNLSYDEYLGIYS